MNYQLKNDKLTVTVASLGAEILSVKRGDTEYMWQRDPRYWKGTAPVLFPFCGRSWDNVYTYGDKTFEMCRKYVDEVVTVSESEIAESILWLLKNRSSLPRVQALCLLPPSPPARLMWQARRWWPSSPAATWM